MIQDLKEAIHTFIGKPKPCNTCGGELIDSYYKTNVGKIYSILRCTNCNLEYHPLTDYSQLLEQTIFYTKKKCC